MKKQALTYTLEIEHHDDGYLAYFPALPGCHTWGKTYEAAVRYAEEALSGYLETLAKHGDPIPVEIAASPTNPSLLQSFHAPRSAQYAYTGALNAERTVARFGLKCVPGYSSRNALK